MLLLTDRSFEIPAFLQRNSDGSFRYPDVAVPLLPVFTATVTDIPEPAPRLTEADLKAIEEIKAQEAAGLTVQKMFEQDRREERKIRKNAEKERLKENRLKQRKVFAQHFKWDWEQ